MRYTCCDERRLRAVKEAGVLNGIEYVEVYDQGPPPPNDPLRQRGLYVRLLQAAGGTDAGGRTSASRAASASAPSRRRRRPPPSRRR